jgi:hypothetical protein
MEDPPTINPPQSTGRAREGKNVKGRFRVYGVAVLALAGAATVILWPQTAGSQQTEPGNRVLAHALAVELGRAQPRPHEAHVSSGALYTALEASGELDRRAALVRASAGNGSGATPPTTACQKVFKAGSLTNTRVNQDCSLRKQSEEVVVANPLNPKNLIAGQNDFRIGFNHCGYDWSFDGGASWGDQIAPFYGITNFAGHTMDACSDPTATFDSHGNAYMAGVLFDLYDPDSAVAVMKSNAPIGGAFWHQPDSSYAFQTSSVEPPGVPAEDYDPNIFNDKDFIVADAIRAARRWTTSM